MTQEQWLIFGFKVVTIAAVLSLTAWIVIYTRIAAWWRNPIGQTLVAKTALIALLLVPTILSLFFHLNRLTSYVAGWVDVALIGLITPVMIWRSAVWIQIHRNGTHGTLPAGECDKETPHEEHRPLLEVHRRCRRAGGHDPHELLRRRGVDACCGVRAGGGGGAAGAEQDPRRRVNAERVLSEAPRSQVGVGV